MKEREVVASPYRLVKYFFLAVTSITFFVLLKALSGSWFIDGFSFATDSLEAFAISAVIFFAYYKFGMEVWRFRLNLTDRLPQIFSAAIGFLLVIISIYFLSQVAMIFSYTLVRFLGLDPLQGYVP